MNSTLIETLIAGYYDYSKHVIVPNIGWGLNIHECDLLIVTAAGYATEIEIKISKADLKKDLSKKHGHHSNKIKKLFFAIPENLESCIDLIPPRAGIYIIRKNENMRYGHYVEKIRDAMQNENCKPLDEKEMKQLMRLGTMRIWSLKHSVIDKTNQLKHAREKLKHLPSPAELDALNKLVDDSDFCYHDLGIKNVIKQMNIITGKIKKSIS
jgi:hypothetical protein